MLGVISSGPLVAGFISLSDLDLSQMQDDKGQVADPGQLRTHGGGLVLRPGNSLWVDLKGQGVALKATVAPLPGSRGGAVRCRFSTANDVRTLVLGPDSRPGEVSLPLKGKDLLLIEALPENGTSGITVQITASALEFAQARPQAWGGEGPILFDAPAWRVRVDGRSGGLSQLQHPKDPLNMEWIRQAAPWGTGWIDVAGKRHAWDRPRSLRRTGAQAMEATYLVQPVRITVRRSIDGEQRLHESYTFENTSDHPVVLGAGGVGIRAPLVDSYPGADVCLTQRCHVHLWMGGTSAYVNALRMGGAAPHLGLVVREGALERYSIHDHIDHSNDRGQFVLHPPAIQLAPGKSYTMSWDLFWHDGRADFFAKVRASERYLELRADRYTVSLGEPLHIAANASAPLEGVELLVNGKQVPVEPAGGRLETEIPTTALGEHLIQVRSGSQNTFLRAFVTLPPEELIRNRVRFIIEHQQRRDPGDALDGAYLVYDNETGQQVHGTGFSDHNAGRERLAMGVLGARYHPLCDDADLKQRLAASLEAYDAFISRELQNERGVVFNDPGRRGKERFYNYPWVIQFHLAMYEAFDRPVHLRRAVDACRAYYDRGGDRFFSIGMPVTEMLRALSRAGWQNERKEMLARFQKHAGTLAGFGRAYPKHEVNYEQSIVGPAAQLMLEVHAATGDPALLKAAEEQLELLELFNGSQPDYHLHEVAIRHWDGYWFGKRRLYGDTFPHYWSTISGNVFALYARATGRPEYAARARAALENNFCLFAPDGRAWCAHLYPLTINGERGEFMDPWANDQDWALVAWLQFGRDLGKATGPEPSSR